MQLSEPPAAMPEQFTLHGIPPQNNERLDDPKQCSGRVPSGKSNYRCTLRGTTRVGDKVYCRHHIPALAIKHDGIPGTKYPEHFDGPAFDPEKDVAILAGHLLAVFKVMRSGNWLTDYEISEASGCPVTSVGAQRRHLRKPRFGSHTVERRRRVVDGEETRTHEYKLTPNPNVQMEFADAK